MRRGFGGLAAPGEELRDGEVRVLADAGVEMRSRICEEWKWETGTVEPAGERCWE